MYLHVSPHHSAVACCVLVLGASSAVPDGQTDRDTRRDRHPQPGVTVPPHYLWSLSTTGHPRALKPNFGGISASSPTAVPIPQSPLWLSSIDAIGSSYKPHGDLPALYNLCSSCRPCWQPWQWASGGRNRDQPSGVKKPQILQSLTAGGAAWSLSQFLLISLACSHKNVTEAEDPDWLEAAGEGCSQNPRSSSGRCSPIGPPQPRPAGETEGEGKKLLRSQAPPRQALSRWHGNELIIINSPGLYQLVNCPLEARSSVCVHKRGLLLAATRAGSGPVGCCSKEPPSLTSMDAR